MDPEARFVITASDRTAAAFRSAEVSMRGLASSVRSTNSLFRTFGAVFAVRMFSNFMSDALKTSELLAEQRAALDAASSSWAAFGKEIKQAAAEKASFFAPYAGAVADSLRATFFPDSMKKSLDEMKAELLILQKSLIVQKSERDNVDFLERFVGMDEAEWDRRIKVTLADIATLKRQIENFGQPAYQTEFFGGGPPDASQLAFRDKVRDEQAKATAERMKAKATEMAEQLRFARTLTEQMKTDVERQAEAWDQAAAAFKGGFIDAKTYTRFQDSLFVGLEEMHDVVAKLPAEFRRWSPEMNAFAASLRNAKEEIDPLQREFNSFFTSIGHGMQSALADAMLGIGDSWSDMLRRMTAEFASSMLFTSLAGMPGGTGSFFTKLGFGGARAAGGPVSRGKAYLVGERGPEMFVPGRSGAIVPRERGPEIWSPGSSGYVERGDPIGVKVVVENYGSPDNVKVSTGQDIDGTAVVRLIVGAVNEGLGRGQFDQGFRHRFGMMPTVGTR